MLPLGRNAEAESNQSIRRALEGAAELSAQLMKTVWHGRFGAIPTRHRAAKLAMLLGDAAAGRYLGQCYERNPNFQADLSHWTRSTAPPPVASGQYFRCSNGQLARRQS